MDLLPMFHYLNVGYTADGARLFPEVQGERTRCWSQVAASEIAAGYKEAVLHCESGEALEQVAQRGCGVSIPGFFQKSVYVTSSVVPSLESFSLIRGDEDFLDRKKNQFVEGRGELCTCHFFLLHVPLLGSPLMVFSSSIQSTDFHGASKIYHLLATKSTEPYSIRISVINTF